MKGKTYRLLGVVAAAALVIAVKAPPSAAWTGSGPFWTHYAGEYIDPACVAAEPDAFAHEGVATAFARIWWMQCNNPAHDSHLVDCDASSGATWTCTPEGEGDIPGRADTDFEGFTDMYLDMNNAKPAGNMGEWEAWDTMAGQLGAVAGDTVENHEGGELPLADWHVGSNRLLSQAFDVTFWIRVEARATAGAYNNHGGSEVNVDGWLDNDGRVNVEPEE